MTIGLALADAGKNCEERGATAIITLKSGVQLEGKLKRRNGHEAATETAHMEMAHGGWVTIDTTEVAAVEAKPQERF